MPVLFASIPWIIAQNAAGAGAGGAAGGNPTGSYLQFLPFVAVLVLWFYVLLIRPQQKQEQARKALMSALKKNDRVITTAGIYGTVVSVDDNLDRVTLRIDDDKGIRAVFTKGSIIRLIDGTEGKEKASKDKAAETA